jgi:hypothetical protein
MHWTGKVTNTACLYSVRQSKDTGFSPLLPKKKLMSQMEKLFGEFNPRLLVALLLIQLFCQEL